MVGLGILYVLLTFIACFALVHIIKLTVVGFLSFKRKKPPVQAEKKPEVKKEPVYYIVEKKRAKRTYSEPREIKFKE